MKDIDEIVNKLECLEMFKIEKDFGLDWGEESTWLEFDREKAYNFINLILCKNTGFKKSFKKSISTQLNKISLKGKEWLLKKLQKQINYQK